MEFPAALSSIHFPFLYRLCYVVILEVVLLYYFTSVCCSFLLYLVWVFCLIPVALYCSWKLFLLAQNKCVPLSSIYLDVAAKLENKNKKKGEREREIKEDDEKENKLRTLLYSCNIIFCWIKKYLSNCSLSSHLRANRLAQKKCILYHNYNMFTIFVVWEVGCENWMWLEWVQNVSDAGLTLCMLS